MRLVPRIVIASLVVCVAAATSASTPTLTSTITTSSTTSSKQTPNGISVGRPKVFDNRTLTIMLESLGQTLQGMQSFVNQTTLAAALGNIQGSRTTENLTSMSLEALPIPSLKTESTVKTGNVKADGTALPDTTDVKTTADRAAFTPTPPTLADAPAFSGFTPSFGASAGDLLNDQVNLTYQIFNLRMILERSLSDRLIEKEPRLQAVLGFNVTLDPPRTAVDAVAVVEITLRAKSGGPVSLVAMMPQEKTYNAATLSTKSRAFGGSAVVKAIEVGASTRRRSQIFYLYRDNDTIAYERMNPEKPNELVIGWMFRPVLGRRSVAPGFRQLLAVASLPTKDLCTADSCAGDNLDADVRTYWKKYDADTLTSFENHDANRRTRFKYATTFGLTRPQIFGARYLNTNDYKDVVVKPTSEFDGNLGPIVDRVSWTPVGPKGALVSVVGKNFFTGTQLILGDKKYTAADGVVLKSNNAFELTTTLDALSSGPAVISGRYGAAVPVSIASEDLAFCGIVIDSAVLGPAVAGTRTVEITIKKRPQNALALNDLPRNPADNTRAATPLVSVNGNTMPLPYDIAQADDGVVIRGTIPDTFVASGSRLFKVSWPFLSDRWSAVTLQTDLNRNFSLTRLGDKTFLLQSTEDAGFEMNKTLNDLPQGSCWHVIVGGKPIALKTLRCGGDAQTTRVGSHAVLLDLKEPPPEKLILIEPGKAGAVYQIEVPKTAAAAAAAAAASSAAAAKALTVAQFDSVFVDLTVADATKVAGVEANQLALKFKSKENDDKKIRVHLTRELTAKPGNVDIIVLDASGKTSTARLVITPCAECKTGEKS